MRSMKGIMFFICVTLLLSMPITASESHAKVYTIKFATSHPPMIPSGSIPLELEKIIPERTNGRVEFKAFLGSSLYGDYEAPTQVHGGALEMAYGGFNMSAICPAWNTIAGMPFIIDTYDHFLRFTKTEAFLTINRDWEAKGIKHVALCGQPGFSDIFNSVRPVKSIEDAKGVRMRIPPIPGLVEMARQVGFQSVTISMAEVPTSLRTGLVDGTFAPILKMKEYDLTKTAPHATIINTTAIPVTFIASAKFWNSLPNDLQGILQEVFEEYGEKMRKEMEQMEAHLWKVFEAAPGTTITRIEGAEKEKWLQIAKPLWEAEKKKSKESRMVIEALEATR